MGRIGKGVKCSVSGCSNEAARSIHIKILAAHGLYGDIVQYETDNASKNEAYFLGLVYQELGKFVEAEKWARMSLDKAPDNADAMILLSQILLEKEQKHIMERKDGPRT